MSIINDIEVIEKNLRSKKAKILFKKLCERFNISQAIEREIYLDRQEMMAKDPKRKCYYCGNLGGQHYQFCNIETDGAPDLWVVE